MLWAWSVGGSGEGVLLSRPGLLVRAPVRQLRRGGGGPAIGPELSGSTISDDSLRLA